MILYIVLARGVSKPFSALYEPKELTGESTSGSIEEPTSLCVQQPYFQFS